jgi:hypothetical protein
LSPEKEHHDFPWFWSMFLPLPVTSPANAAPAPRLKATAAVVTAIPNRLMTLRVMRTPPPVEVGLATGVRRESGDRSLGRRAVELPRWLLPPLPSISMPNLSALLHRICLNAVPARNKMKRKD